MLHIWFECHTNPLKDGWSRGQVCGVLGSHMVINFWGWSLFIVSAPERILQVLQKIIPALYDETHSPPTNPSSVGWVVPKERTRKVLDTRDGSCIWGETSVSKMRMLKRTVISVDIFLIYFQCLNTGSDSVEAGKELAVHSFTLLLIDLQNLYPALLPSLGWSRRLTD